MYKGYGYTHCGEPHRRAKKWEGPSSIPVTLRQLRCNFFLTQLWEVIKDENVSHAHWQRIRNTRGMHLTNSFCCGHLNNTNKALVVCPQIDPCNAAATTFKLPCIKPAHTRNLHRAANHYTCHSTHLLMSFYRTFRDGYSVAAEGLCGYRHNTVGLMLPRQWTRVNFRPTLCHLIFWLSSRREK